MIWKVVLIIARQKSSRSDLRAGGDAHPSSEEGIRAKHRWLRHGTLLMTCLSCSSSTCVSTAHNEANPSCEGTHGRHNTHQAPSQIRTQGLGLAFLYYAWMLHCLYTQNAYVNPFPFVISQDIPDELLTLTFWLKVLMHLLSPVICSALSNLQCFLCFSGEGYNSNELESYSFVVSQILCNTKGLSKHFTFYCICWTGYRKDLILLSLPIVSLRQI